MEALIALVREALVVVALLCLPVLAVATAVGTAVAVLQAATQVQEQTLTLLPKMLAVGATIAAFGSFAFGLCAALFADVIQALPALVRGT